MEKNSPKDEKHEELESQLVVEMDLSESGDSVILLQVTALQINYRTNHHLTLQNHKCSWVRK